MKSKTDWACYDIINEVYLANTLATEFTKDISKAKHFAWLGFFSELYIFSLEKMYPQKMFAWRKVIHLQNWEIDISNRIK